MHHLKLSALIAVFFTLQVMGGSESSSFRLEEVWATDRVMAVPESVLYDAERNVIYVANINGGALDVDGNGTISKLGPDGALNDLDWVTGLNAPKGMTLDGDTLYVADINRVVSINVITGNVISSKTIENAKFLNDVAIGPSGTLYVTDTLLGRIYVLRDDGFEVFHDWGTDTRVNGILSSGEDLYVTLSNNGTLLRLRGNPPVSELVAEGLGGADGLVRLPDGRLLACDWNGRILLVGEDGHTRQLLDTRDKGIQMADVDIIPETSRLIAVTFQDNRVVCYQMIKD